MADEEKVKLSVEIYGEIYNMKVSQDHGRTLQIVEMVDKMMHKIGSQTQMLSYKDVAVLAALNIAEEYFKLQDDYQVLVNLIEERN